MVPATSTESGITLKADPACTIVTLTIPSSTGERLRDTTVWSCWTMAVAATMGSTTPCPMPAAACPPLPTMWSSNCPAAASSGPDLAPTSPVLSQGHRWMPNILSTLGLDRTPSCTIAKPPAPPSSAGWNTMRTVPLMSFSFCLSSLAAPSSIDMCPSCPQACILPGFLDANSLVSSDRGSTTGSASMSLLRATTGDCPVPMVPTRPSLAMGYL
mmetsp:Transcript_36638/g.93585  ORF Transcript_36638/g.93585 Transcript_36638/m.93585 type:complete len:214 (-) Transcript_36638:287-928(-)